MRILLVQIAGDYREAWGRLQSGGNENYRAQRVHVQVVEDLARQHEAVGQLTYLTDTAFDEVLPNNVRAIGMGQRTMEDDGALAKIEEFAPTHLVLRLLNPKVLEWAVKHPQIRSMVLCAETRQTRHPLHWWRNRKLAKMLNGKPIEWACNHQVNASRWMEKIGVNAKKIIPWDFEFNDTPDAFPAKTLRSSDGPWNLVFVGSVIDGKGVPEILAAVKHLQDEQFPVRVRLAGRGEEDRYRAQAEALGIGDRVEFMGLVPNEQAFRLMREGDLVLVPSRHNYTEGFPLTLLEGLMSRTPVVTSDHPMFQSKIVGGESGLLFPAGNGRALANMIRQALTDAELYHRLSIGGANTWRAMQIPCRWGDVLRHWLDDDPSWLHEHRLESGKYQ